MDAWLILSISTAGVCALDPDRLLPNRIVSYRPLQLRTAWAFQASCERSRRAGAVSTHPASR